MAGDLIMLDGMARVGRDILALAAIFNERHF